MSNNSQLLFTAGGMDLAVPSLQVNTIHEQLPIQPVPGTHKWFLGMAVAEGQLLPVTDLGAFLNNQPASGRLLQLAPHLGIVGLQIDNVIGVVDNLPEELPLEKQCKPIDGSCFSSLGVRHNGQVYGVIDVAQLIQSSRFLDISRATERRNR